MNNESITRLRAQLLDVVRASNDLQGKSDTWAKRIANGLPKLVRRIACDDFITAVRAISALKDLDSPKSAADRLEYYYIVGVSAERYANVFLQALPITLELIALEQIDEAQRTLDTIREQMRKRRDGTHKPYQLISVGRDAQGNRTISAFTPA